MSKRLDLRRLRLWLLRRRKYFWAWLATWVGVRVFTKFLEIPLQSPFPTFCNPNKKSLCSSSVHGTPKKKNQSERNKKKTKQNKNQSERNKIKSKSKRAISDSEEEKHEYLSCARDYGRRREQRRRKRSRCRRWSPEPGRTAIDWSYLRSSWRSFPPWLARRRAWLRSLLLLRRRRRHFRRRKPPCTCGSCGRYSRTASTCETWSPATSSIGRSFFFVWLTGKSNKTCKKRGTLLVAKANGEGENGRNFGLDI